MQIGESDMANLIANYLGPAMANAGLSTKLLGWDFTWDNETYPEQLLSDPTVAPYLAGTAWHCYAGDPSAMTDVHNFAPSKDNFETECSGLISNGAGEPVRTDATQFSDTMNLFINSTRNWARSVILWNIALNQLGGPTIGCLTCRPLVTITFNPLNLLTNPWDWAPAIEYYAIGQTAKFVRPGAVRIDSSTDSTGINDAAFVNTDGSKVLVATNNGSSTQTFSVQWGGQYFSYTLNPGAAATFTWTDS
jgi:glucosylceramidase